MLSRFLAVLSLSTLLLIPLVSAQTTDASVSGTVTDPSGSGRSFRTLRNRSLDKTILSFNRTNVVKANGIWELPFGPNKSLGRNMHGVLAQTGWILTMQSGAPMSLKVQITSLQGISL
jgi:hypothetical protein